MDREQWTAWKSSKQCLCCVYPTNIESYLLYGGVGVCHMTSGPVPTGPPDLMSCSDSSDDEDDSAPGMAALHANDESDDDVDIDPYWAAIRIDELRGLGKPKEVVDKSSLDSLMPDLKAISTIATPDSMTLCDSDEELDEYELKGHWLDGLEKDEGEEAFTHTFDCAMLVNVQGSLKDTITELYDSGAS